MNYRIKFGVALVIAISVMFFSNCNVPPFVIILNPKGGDFDYNEVITVDVTAGSNKGIIEKVSLYIDGKEYGSLDSPPYTFKFVPANLGLTSGTRQISVSVKNNKNKKNTASDFVNITVRGTESAPPALVTFAYGRIPSAWYPTEWEVDNTTGHDDNFSIRAPKSGISISATRTGGTASNSVEFWLKGQGVLNFYIDGTKKECNLTPTWQQHIFIFGSGTHTFRWESVGLPVNLDDILFRTSDATGVLSIGAYHDGGIVAFYNRDTKRGFIAAPYDQSAGVPWSSTINTTGATSRAFGTGKENTAKIINALGDGSYAARLCYDLRIGGHDDWYLPSEEELDQLKQYKDKIGGFHPSRYWTSSAVVDKIDSIEKFARWISFGTGTHSEDPKQFTYRVRAIRDFSID